MGIAALGLRALHGADVLSVCLVCQGWTIVDVRIEGDYAKGHCEGAINLPLFRFVQVLDTSA